MFLYMLALVGSEYISKPYWSSGLSLYLVRLHFSYLLLYGFPLQDVSATFQNVSARAPLQLL